MESHWIFDQNLTFCANCGASIYPHYLPAPYCTYCGCKMTNYKIRRNDIDDDRF